MEDKAICILGMIGLCIFIALLVWCEIQDQKKSLKIAEVFRKEEIERTTENE